MKRILPILFLLSFLFTLIGSHLVFFHLQTQNKIQISDLLEQNESLSILRIQKDDIGKIAFHNKWNEISYNGKMYDVKEHSIEGDFIILSCIADEIETELLADLDENIQNNIDTKSSGEKKKSNPTKLTLNDYCVNTNRSKLPRPFESAIFNSTDPRITSFATPISSPPPRIIFS